MIVGLLKERKKKESRVGLTPWGVEELVRRGHKVLVEVGAGVGSGYSDEAYVRSGGEIKRGREEIYGEAGLIVKVKELLGDEYGLIREGQIVFTFFHFASDEALTKAVIKSGCHAIAYETIRGKDVGLPILMPMSEVAGKMAVQIGAHYLQRENGGRGVLLGGVSGVRPGKVLILGGGVVGSNAARVAAGMGALVYVLDINVERLKYLSEVMTANVVPLYSDEQTLRELLGEVDLVVNGILIPGAKAPKLISRGMLKGMKEKAVVIDVAIDQGGGLETSRVTDHEKPVYEEEGVVHYCVPNIPGAVPVTSTVGLTNATFPYVLKLADKGLGALKLDRGFLEGANILGGKVTHKGVAEAFGMGYVAVEEAIDKL